MTPEGFHIVPGNKGPHVICRAANGETLSHSENFTSQSAADNNICAQLRAGFRQILAMADASTLAHALEAIGCDESDMDRLAEEMLSVLIATGKARLMSGPVEPPMETEG